MTRNGATRPKKLTRRKLDEESFDASSTGMAEECGVELCYALARSIIKNCRKYFPDRALCSEDMRSRGDFFDAALTSHKGPGRCKRNELAELYRRIRLFRRYIKAYTQKDRHTVRSSVRDLLRCYEYIGMSESEKNALVSRVMELDTEDAAAHAKEQRLNEAAAQEYEKIQGYAGYLNTLRFTEDVLFIGKLIKFFGQ
ncbi:hypothetical protein PAPHI01_0947 [Pancytospora philotis]|nr:hypothetical protein PAPHI01_0947 [Pancytospora philotis]